MNKNNLIVFIVPSRKSVNGGVMSIFSLCKESRQFRDIHQSDVVLCTYIGYPSYHNNDLFENDEYIYDFDEIVQKYPNLDSLTINIPELVVNRLDNELAKYNSYISNIRNFTINILNQNILYMPTKEDIFKLYKYTPSITQTTAHNRYAKQETSNEYGLPLKHMSVFIDPSQYTKALYREKRNLIAYSPDSHPLKSKILKKMQQELSDYELVEIKDVSYSDYKNIAKDAKFMITFGEGLDGYFIESSFSGSIPLAVYNDKFFPDNSFQDIETVYVSYDDMFDRIVADIKQLDEEKIYKKIGSSIYKKLSSIYSYDSYINNLKNFYLEKFDYYPTFHSMQDVVLYPLKNLFKSEEKVKLELARKDKLLKEKTNELNTIISSRSWKITKPLRQFSNSVKRLTKKA